MATKQEEAEMELTRWKQHKNKQTFGADSSTLIAETIDTPGVSMSGRVACIIGQIRVLPIFGTALNVLLNYYRCQLAGGTQAAFVDVEDQKHIAEFNLRQESTATGVSSMHYWPVTMDDGLQPMIVVNPKMTILHQSINLPDLASEDVYVMFDYMNVAMTLEMHQALIVSTMNIS